MSKAILVRSLIDSIPPIFGSVEPIKGVKSYFTPEMHHKGEMLAEAVPLINTLIEKFLTNKVELTSVVSEFAVDSSLVRVYMTKTQTIVHIDNEVKVIDAETLKAINEGK